MTLLSNKGGHFLTPFGGQNSTPIDNQERVHTLKTPTNSITYTAEQQIADFGSPQKSITLKLYAIGHTVGRGFPLETTL